VFPLVAPKKNLGSRLRCNAKDSLLLPRIYYSSMCNSNLNTERTLFRSMHTWMMDRWIGRAGSIFSWAEGRANNLFVWLQIRAPKYLHAGRRGRTDADRARIRCRDGDRIQDIALTTAYAGRHGSQTFHEATLRIGGAGRPPGRGVCSAGPRGAKLAGRQGHASRGWISMARHVASCASPHQQPHSTCQFAATCRCKPGGARTAAVRCHRIPVGATCASVLRKASPVTRRTPENANLSLLLASWVELLPEWSGERDGNRGSKISEKPHS
jgi:hypothetical protein